MSSITPYNNYKVNDLTGNKQPYVSSTTEFGYFGNLGSVLNCNSMPTNLLTNNGIATVYASGLHILNAGIYTLKVSVDCSATSMATNNDGIIYFNFGTNKLTNVAYGNVSGSFGGSQLNKMFSFGSNAQGYPGIIAWLTNSDTQGTNPTASKYLVSNNQLLWGYYCNNNTTNGPLDSGICTTKITFNISQPTTIYFNIGCIDDNFSTIYHLTMGTSYFTLDLISNITPILNWTPTSAPPNEQWHSIASDSTGQNLVAAIYYYTGNIYRSSNYGVSWSPLQGPGLPSHSTDNINTYWRSIASSSDGTHLAAVIEYGYIYTSTDSGGSWTKQTAAGSKQWWSIASSSDGTILAAVAYNGGIWRSVTSGIWYGISPATGSWYSIASSSDGSRLAAVINGGTIYTSDTSGNSWSTRGPGNNLPPSASWVSIASSSDGTKLAAAVNVGYIYTSTDSGASWSTNFNSSGSRVWLSIASSSDGTRLAAVVNGGGIYISTDSGVSWSLTNAPSSSSTFWQTIASSSDGTRLVAGINLGSGIYTGVYGY